MLYIQYEQKYVKRKFFFYLSKVKIGNADYRFLSDYGIILNTKYSENLYNMEGIWQTKLILTLQAFNALKI